MRASKVGAGRARRQPAVTHMIMHLQTCCAFKVQAFQLGCNPSHQVFNQDVLGRVDSAIQAAGRWMQDASSTLESSKQAAQAALDDARSQVDGAKADVATAFGAFDAARSQVRWAHRTDAA